MLHGDAGSVGGSLYGSPDMASNESPLGSQRKGRKTRFGRVGQGLMLGGHGHGGRGAETDRGKGRMLSNQLVASSPAVQELLAQHQAMLEGRCGGVEGTEGMGSGTPQQQPSYSASEVMFELTNEPGQGAAWGDPQRLLPPPQPQMLQEDWSRRVQRTDEYLTSLPALGK